MENPVYDVVPYGESGSPLCQIMHEFITHGERYTRAYPDRTGSVVYERELGRHTSDPRMPQFILVENADDPDRAKFPAGLEPDQLRVFEIGPGDSYCCPACGTGPIQPHIHPPKGDQFWFCYWCGFSQTYVVGPPPRVPDGARTLTTLTPQGHFDRQL